MDDNKSVQKLCGCDYCRENDRAKIRAVKIVYLYEDPKAYGYPEVAYWDRTYAIERCPICGRKIGG